MLTLYFGVRKKKKIEIKIDHIMIPRNYLHFHYNNLMTFTIFTTTYLKYLLFTFYFRYKIKIKYKFANNDLN